MSENIPAFPTNDVCYNGMTLRDYFAAHATEKDVQNYINDYSEMVDGIYFSPASGKFETTKLPKKRTREQAKYLYADAMMEVRNV